jgi:L-sorbose 1-phosphate reductase
MEATISDKLDSYRNAIAAVPSKYKLWPLYGAGLQNLGKDGKPIEVATLAFGPDELLIRHDACGLCFSDTKVIAQGQNHPRIFRNMQKEPIVLGHEVSMTILGVGENLRGQYHVGDRLTLETDIFIKGKALAYGYWFQGGLSQYSIIGPDIYASDLGNNLIPVGREKGYAEIALTEPWACVVAAYALKYRDGIKSGGTLWVIGAGVNKPYTISAGFDEASHPARLMLTAVPEPFHSWLRNRAQQLGVEVLDVPDVAAPPVEFADDIVLLGGDASLMETVSPRLGQFGMMALLADAPLSRTVNIDVGRIHYQRWVYVGSQGADIAGAYKDVPVRANLKPGGRAWFVGAGGPMGRMHVQRAIEFNHPPARMVCTDVSEMRLDELRDTFGEEAKRKGIDFVCLNPAHPGENDSRMSEYQRMGFDDIVVLAPIPAVISDASHYLAANGVMNVFAGVARGTMAALDMSQTYRKNTRIIGHSASLMEDFQLVLEKNNAGELNPNRSVAAVGSLSAARDGLQAVLDATLAGKVVIYPNIQEMPLTTLAQLKEKLPTVFARLNERGEWTNEAEEEFLRQMLP